MSPNIRDSPRFIDIVFGPRRHLLFVPKWAMVVKISLLQACMAEAKLDCPLLPKRAKRLSLYLQMGE